jgi:DNA-binding MarR family transcriptional regulator
MPPSVLADRMGMTKGAISKLADRLLAKGLIERTDNPQDKRAHSLSLTTDGRAKVPVLASLADANDAEFFGVLTKVEHEALDLILRSLAEGRGLKTTPVE